MMVYTSEKLSMVQTGNVEHNVSQGSVQMVYSKYSLNCLPRIYYCCCCSCLGVLLLDKAVLWKCVTHAEPWLKSSE